MCIIMDIIIPCIMFTKMWVHIIHGSTWCMVKTGAQHTRGCTGGPRSLGFCGLMPLVILKHNSGNLKHRKRKGK